MIPVLGIIGGIGSGKSAVADVLQKLGGHLIAADQLGHDALVQPDIKTKLVERWGRSILNDQEIPDRKAIGRIVFSNKEELRVLESLVFPYIEKRIIEEIAHARSRPDVKWIILDAAIMVETGWHKHCDKILFVDSPRELRLARLKEKRGWDEKELARRECMQMPLEEKKSYADTIIVNDADLEKVARQVKDALVRWKVIC
jgi:dephospho-CoA kinase